MIMTVLAYSLFATVIILLTELYSRANQRAQNKTPREKGTGIVSADQRFI